MKQKAKRKPNRPLSQRPNSTNRKQPLIQKLTVDTGDEPQNSRAQVRQTGTSHSFSHHLTRIQSPCYRKEPIQNTYRNTLDLCVT